MNNSNDNLYDEDELIETLSQCSTDDVHSNNVKKHLECELYTFLTNINNSQYELLKELKVIKLILMIFLFLIVIGVAVSLIGTYIAMSIL